MWFDLFYVCVLGVVLEFLLFIGDYCSVRECNLWYFYIIVDVCG